jgi:hypothetical protein
LQANHDVGSSSLFGGSLGHFDGGERSGGLFQEQVDQLDDLAAAFTTTSGTSLDLLDHTE